MFTCRLRNTFQHFILTFTSNVIAIIILLLKCDVGNRWTRHDVDLKVESDKSQVKVIPGCFKNCHSWTTGRPFQNKCVHGGTVFGVNAALGHFSAELALHLPE